jgi:hypothetical protein
MKILIILIATTNYQFRFSRYITVKITISRQRIQILLQPSHHLMHKDFYIQISMKRRGRKIGDNIKRKRKTFMEFSENPYTKKGRSRIKIITETEKVIKKTKNSDR